MSASAVMGLWACIGGARDAWKWFCSMHVAWGQCKTAGMAAVTWNVAATFPRVLALISCNALLRHSQACHHRCLQCTTHPLHHFALRLAHPLQSYELWSAGANAASSPATFGNALGNANQPSVPQPSVSPPLSFANAGGNSLGQPSFGQPGGFGAASGTPTFGSGFGNTAQPQQPMHSPAPAQSPPTFAANNALGASAGAPGGLFGASQPGAAPAPAAGMPAVGARAIWGQW